MLMFVFYLCLPQNVIVSPASEDCVISSVSFTDEYPESIFIDSLAYTDHSLTIEVHFNSVLAS